MTVVVTQAVVEAGLRKLGLGRASQVIVHASLRSFGHVDGGADAVARALVAVCGTVVVPSGTWDHTGVPVPPGSSRPNNAALVSASWHDFDDAVRAAVPYRPDLPIDRELGAIPEAVRRGFPHVRGSHPLFAFLAVGADAEPIVSAGRLDWPLGALDVMADLGGHVLLLGVDHTTNTTIHLAEQRLGRSRFFRYAKLAEGVWAELPNVSGESHRFDDLEPVLRAMTREVTIGSCRARLVSVVDVLRAATDAIGADPAALLCGDAQCRCGAALEQRRAAIAADITPSP